MSELTFYCFGFYFYSLMIELSQKVYPTKNEEIEYQNIPPNHDKDDWYDIKYSDIEQDRIKNEKKVYEKKATEDDIISLFDDTLDDEDLPF